MAWGTLLAVGDVGGARLVIVVAGRAWGCGGHTGFGAAVEARLALLALCLSLDLLKLAWLA